eukprot:g55878.t1
MISEARCVKFCRRVQGYVEQMGQMPRLHVLDEQSLAYHSLCHMWTYEDQRHHISFVIPYVHEIGTEHDKF